MSFNTLFFIISTFVTLCCATATTKNTTTKATTAATTTPESTCAAHSGVNKCGDCLSVSGAKCLWCFSGNSSDAGVCKPYPVSSIIPRYSDCPLTHARWGVCWVNYEILLIVMGVIGGLILITCVCCVYCCCCRTNGRKLAARWKREDDRMDLERQERSERQNQRKQERQAQLDAIRQKYGLTGDPSYSKLDT